jgi:hypothetical protein
MKIRSQEGGLPPLLTLPFALFPLPFGMALGLHFSPREPEMRIV